MHAPHPNNKALSSIRVAAALLALPFAQFLFFRLYLHFFLGLRIGWGPLLTDFDLIVPLPVAFVLFVFFHEARGDFQLRFKGQGAALNLALGAMFLAFNHALSFAAVPVTGPVALVWWITVLCVLGSAFFWWVPPSFYFSRKNAWLWGMCAVVCSSTILVSQGFHPVWLNVAPTIASGIAYLSTTFSLGFDAVFQRESIFLVHRKLTLIVNQGCGGLDGFILASCTVVFLAVSLKKKLSLMQYTALTFFAWNLMFLLNIIRITLLFGLGIWLRGALGPETGGFIFLKLAHAHFGWIVYGFGAIQVATLANWIALRNAKAVAAIAPTPAPGLETTLTHPSQN